MVSSSSLWLGEPSSSQELPGNLALCRTNPDTSDDAVECLGWPDRANDVMKPWGHIRDDGNDPIHLNWRYQDGLLRSVGPDGYATDRCLGPIQNVTALNGKTREPYELVLQDCPNQQQHHHGTSENENIFLHPGVSTQGSTQPSSLSAASNATRTEDTAAIPRHLQFLVLGDGRVQSLAPVYFLQKPWRDFITTKPFCVTAMKWGSDEHTKAYLIPCRDSGDEDEETFLESSEPDREDHTQTTRSQQQQVFDLGAGSSFDPFLVDLSSDQDQSLVHLAFQTGVSNQAEQGTHDSFEEFRVRVQTCDETSSLRRESSVMFDTVVVSSREMAAAEDASFFTKGGIVMYPLAGFKEHGSMEARLVGRSKMDATVLASTQFQVSEPAKSNDPFPNTMTWTLLAFWAFMLVYVLIVGVNNVFCPDKNQRKKRQRDSELTAETTTMPEDMNIWEATMATQIPNRDVNRMSMQMPTHEVNRLYVIVEDDGSESINHLDHTNTTTASSVPSENSDR